MNKDLTDIEVKYLISLLEYADKELFVYSSVFLREFDIKIEEVVSFIDNLKNKLLKE